MIQSAIIRAVEEFASKPIATAKAMRELLNESAPEAFLSAAVPLLRGDLNRPGVQYLVTLLLINDLILEPLGDPAVFSFDQAVAVGSLLVTTLPLLDSKMRRLFDPPAGRNDNENEAKNYGIRLLEILASVSDDSTVSSIIYQQLDHGNLNIRSKAALLAGRRKRNSKWVEQRLGDPDARVRANAIESLWGVEDPGARDVFLAAASDPNCRMVGNALMGLYRLGDASSFPMIVDMLSNVIPAFRLSGAWVMGETGDPRFMPPLASLISSPDPALRSAVFRSIAKLRRAAANDSAAGT